ncbi:MAG: MBL fold metallo-hydrolase, partial [Polyangiaceae bacterium]|nr:MBL fold metallo-hydrolase [Polyangiaceae bacterium]
GEPARFREGLYRLRPDTYAWMVPNGSWGETNLGLIDCGGTSVLIDTCWDVRLTQEVMAHAASILERSPVELVVNTHADGDHCWGNQLFADKPIIATHACVAQMHHQPPILLHALGLAGGHVLRHLPVAGIDRFGHYMHQMFEPYELEGVRITDPNQAFSVEKTLNVHGLDIVLLEVGPGHTDGDCIVHVPDRGVVYAGDIAFVGVTPVAWAGPVENIVNGLRRVLELEPEVIVPGHGPLATVADVQALIDYWELVQEGIYQRFKQGMSAARAARDLVLSPAFARHGFVQWDSPERLHTTASTLYREWGAWVGPLPGKLGVMDMLRQQATLAFELSEASPRRMHRFG